MKTKQDMNKLGDVYDKSVKDFQREMDVCRLDFAEKHQWKKEEPSDDNLNQIKGLVDKFMEGSGNFCKGKVPSLYEDIEKLGDIFKGMAEDHKKQIEADYLTRVFVKLSQSTKFSEKVGLLKFLYVDRPLKELKSKLVGKKFSLYDHLPLSERTIKSNRCGVALNT